MDDSSLFDRAAAAIFPAPALLVTAGAGMGVDSGLPDFRGSEGFWNAYPPYRRLGLSFSELANPLWFRSDPPFAWGFYGHRRNLYRATKPHDGFARLLAWAKRAEHAFVFTSNVDDHFRKGGFPPEAIAEVHGTIEANQCTAACGIGIFPAGEEEIEVDPSSFRAAPPLPACPNCGALARPNILMFSDWQWEGKRTEAQLRRLGDWLDAGGDRRGVVVECGAGRAIPTVRDLGERLAASGWTLVRINPREPEGPPGTISIRAGALEGLEEIGRRLGE
jgi:NAD-dependent SIR2 family protein deacetylase